MDRSNESGIFRGTVDQLLKHCTSMDVETLWWECEKREMIAMFMTEHDIDHDEATQLYDEYELHSKQLIEEHKMTELNDTVTDMVQKGLLQIVGYTDDGDALYGLTDLGEEVRKTDAKTAKKKKTKKKK